MRGATLHAPGLSFPCGAWKQSVSTSPRSESCGTTRSSGPNTAASAIKGGQASCPNAILGDRRSEAGSVGQWIVNWMPGISDDQT